jgi:hypothetical protein
MLIALVIWIYSAALIAIFQWPDYLSMITTFLLLGTIPLILLIMIMARGKQLGSIRQQQRDRRDADQDSSVQGSVGKIDNQHPGDD